MAFFACQWKRGLLWYLLARGGGSGKGKGVNSKLFNAKNQHLGSDRLLKTMGLESVASRFMGMAFMAGLLKSMGLWISKKPYLRNNYTGIFRGFQRLKTEIIDFIGFSMGGKRPYWGRREIYEIAPFLQYTTITTDTRKQIRFYVLKKRICSRVVESRVVVAEGREHIYLYVLSMAFSKIAKPPKINGLHFLAFPNVENPVLIVARVWHL